MPHLAPTRGHGSTAKSLKYTAMLVGDKLRVSLSRKVLNSDEVLMGGRYTVTPPSGSPAVSIYKVTYAGTYLDLWFSGVIVAGATYSLTIQKRTLIASDDQGYNEADTVTFLGKQLAPAAQSALTSTQSILGKGFAFPLEIASDGQFLRVTDEENVDCSLRLLLCTRQGERPFLVRNGVLFGTKLHKVLFESDDVVQQLVVQTIREAVEVWEPRVRILEIEVRKVETAFLIGVRYLILYSNNVRNLVFPYYLAG